MTSLPLLAGLAAVGVVALGLAVRPSSMTTPAPGRPPFTRSQPAGPAQTHQLMAHGLSAFEIGLIYRWAAERRVAPMLLEQWVVRHGAELLLLCLAAGFSACDLADHLDDVSMLDRRSLELQAELQALEHRRYERGRAETPEGSGDAGSPTWD
jgi:hypothetical protein